MVAQEVLLDLPALVAEAQDEAAHPERAVDLHDVPEDRLLADLDHRLGPVLGLLAQARAHAAAEDDDGKVAGRGLVGHWRAIVALPISRRRRWYNRARGQLFLSSLDASPFLRVAPDPTRSGEAGSVAPDLSVLVPVLDEADSVDELAARVTPWPRRQGLSFEIVFVDDGSRDGTADRIRDAHRRDPRVKLVRLRRNFGKAAALCAGFDHCRGRLVVTMDGDLQDDPDEIPRLLEALDSKDLDLVSGWKRQRNDPASKRWPSRFFNWVTRRLAQVDAPRLQLRLQGLPPRGARAGLDLRRAPPLHPGAREPPRLSRRRDRGAPPSAPPRRLEVRLGPPLQGAARPDHRALHHQVHAPAAAPLRRLRPARSSGSASPINLYLAILWFRGETLSNRPLLLFGVLLMLLGFQMLTTGLLGEMITFKSFRRTDSYSVKELVE